MAMTYRIALLDGGAAGLQETEERLRLYEKEHPGHGMEIACFMETAPFMEAVCGGLEDGEHAFHILFMDISMQDGNGVEDARVLRQKGFGGVIILKAASAEYAVEAWTVGALYYLVSPVSREKFDRAVEKAVRKVRQRYFV